MAEKFVVSANHVWEILNVCYCLPLIRILPQINEIIYFFKENPAESDVNAWTSGRVEGRQSPYLGFLGTYDATSEGWVPFPCGAEQHVDSCLLHWTNYHITGEPLKAFGHPKPLEDDARGPLTSSSFAASHSSLGLVMIIIIDNIYEVHNCLSGTVLSASETFYQ